MPLPFRVPSDSPVIENGGILTKVWLLWFNETFTRLFNPNLPVFANNAAAITGGLKPRDRYRTGGDPDVICVVH